MSGKNKQRVQMGETKLKEIPLTPAIEKLILEGRMPPTMHTYEYGTIGRVVFVTPFEAMPMYMSISIKGRFPSELEIKKICHELIPEGKKVQAATRPLPGTNGYYICEIFEEKVINPDGKQ